MKYGNKLSSIMERSKSVLPNPNLWIKVHSINRPFYYPDKETGIPVFFIIKDGGNGSLEWDIKHRAES